MIVGGVAQRVHHSTKASKSAIEPIGLFARSSAAARSSILGPAFVAALSTRLPLFDSLHELWAVDGAYGATNFPADTSWRHAAPGLWPLRRRARGAARRGRSGSCGNPDGCGRAVDVEHVLRIRGREAVAVEAVFASAAQPDDVWLAVADDPGEVLAGPPTHMSAVAGMVSSYSRSSPGPP